MYSCLEIKDWIIIDNTNNEVDVVDERKGGGGASAVEVVNKAEILRASFNSQSYIKWTISFWSM